MRNPLNALKKLDPKYFGTKMIEYENERRKLPYMFALGIETIVGAGAGLLTYTSIASKFSLCIPDAKISTIGAPAALVAALIATAITTRGRMAEYLEPLARIAEEEIKKQNTQISDNF